MSQLEALEHGLLLSGLANLAVVREAEVLFLALHGGHGEDGTLQTILDMIGVPYTGSGPLGSAMAMDKDIAKRLFQEAGIPTAKWVMAPATAQEVETRLGWPVVVKPSKQGSTVGLTVVRSPGDLAGRHRRGPPVRRRGHDRGVRPGTGADRRYSGRAWPWRWGRSSPGTRFSTTNASTRRACPRRSSRRTSRREVAAECGRLGLLAHQALKLGGYSRVDFRLTPSGEAFCLEVNTLPGMTATSLLPQSARAVGIGFPELCDRICRSAIGNRKVG